MYMGQANQKEREKDLLPNDVLGVHSNERNALNTVSFGHERGAHKAQ